MIATGYAVKTADGLVIAGSFSPRQIAAKAGYLHEIGMFPDCGCKRCIEKLWTQQVRERKVKLVLCALQEVEGAFL